MKRGDRIIAEGEVERQVVQVGIEPNIEVFDIVNDDGDNLTTITSRLNEGQKVRITIEVLK